MQLLTVKAAAARLQTSQHTIYQAIKSGELRWIDVSTGQGVRARVRIDEDDLRAWLKTRESQPARRAS